mmetsp:Transcript_64796/g.171495  ORF Transcript_64796/g.171495 Transcript_64796/m.171495 type:complete len:205 (-) Transcript_64796:1635-2249(-)
MFHRLLVRLGDSLTSTTERVESLHSVSHLFDLRLGIGDLGLDFLEQEGTLPIASVGSELLEAITSLFEALLQHVNLLSDGLGRSLGETSHLHELPRHKSLRIRNRGVHLARCLVCLGNDRLHVRILVAFEKGKFCLRHALQLVFGMTYPLRHLSEQTVSSDADLGLLHGSSHLFQFFCRLFSAILQQLYVLEQRSLRFLGAFHL